MRGQRPSTSATIARPRGRIVRAARATTSSPRSSVVIAARCTNTVAPVLKHSERTDQVSANRLGATTHPIRQPVIAQALEKPFTTTTGSSSFATARNEGATSPPNTLRW